jgi:hypothetical protein
LFDKSNHFLRLESDELRTYQSKALQAGMKAEHMRQIEEKICKERHKLVSNLFELFSQVIALNLSKRFYST